MNWLVRRYRPALQIAIALAIYGAVMALAGENPYYMQVLTLSGINITMAVSLNLINGFTGQFSIGHAGFMAVGAYTSAVMTKFFGLPYVAGLAAGGALAALVGLLVGLPTLRLRGDYLAIATLGFGEIIRVIIVNLDAVGGPRGLIGIPTHTNFAWAYGLALLTMVVIMHFMNSTHGRACLAIREDEIAAETMGIDTTRYKVLAFSMGAMFAGLGGGMFAHLLTYINPSSFGFLKSVDFLVMVVLGGPSITGAAGAAVFLTVLTEALRRVSEWRMLAYSVLLVVVMLTRPKGILGDRELALDTFSRWSSKLRVGGNKSAAP